MMVKSTLKRFGFIKPSSGLYDGEKLLLDGCFTIIILIKTSIVVQETNFLHHKIRMKAL